MPRLAVDTDRSIYKDHSSTNSTVKGTASANKLQKTQSNPWFQISNGTLQLRNLIIYTFEQ